MKISEKEIATRAKEMILAAMQDIPSLEITGVDTPVGQLGTQPDLVAQVTTTHGAQLLIFEIKSSGEPRIARQASNQLLQYHKQYEGAYGIFLAPYVSPKAAEICKEQDVGHIDLSGNCRLSFGGVFIEREGKPNKFAEKRDLRTLYSPKATRVLRVLLTEVGKYWKITEVAEKAGVSLGLVSNVKKLLRDREWLLEAKQGFVLLHPSELLAEWSENYSFRQNEVRDYYSLRSPSKVESVLAMLCSNLKIRYALTAFSAAARMSPAVRYQRTFSYIDTSIEDIALELDLKKVSSGANVNLIRPYDEGVFFDTREFEGVRTVSPIQAYLDLVSFKGRGEEAAREILLEAIEPQW